MDIDEIAEYLIERGPSSYDEYDKVYEILMDIDDGDCFYTLYNYIEGAGINLEYNIDKDCFYIHK